MVLKQLKSIIDLITVNIVDQQIFKPSKLFDIGRKATSCFIASLEVSSVVRKFCENCWEVLKVLVTYLKSKLPLEPNILKNCAYLDP